MNDTPWIEARTIDQENARETFALAARHVLSDVAMEYHAVIYLPDFAAKLQERTRIRYRATPSSWIGDVLFRVAKECRRRAEPLLGALVVNTDGTMPEWWADTVEAVRGEFVENPNLHAANEREELYRVHGAEIPEEGAEPVLPAPAPTPVRARATRATTPRAAAAGTRVPGTGTAARAPRAAKPAKPEPEVRLTQAVEKFCSSCFMVLPATGLCDECD
ncbi:hypothetical protein [Nocardioides yefusunii]|uniref:Uncharacterized protein n=1 Tax=Nocardioides yefusunii TaxID=2500546 RepID=A0ABW1QVV9_9ACTN|nr:hypothetical protein [Nocardioides yefusunii]